jgi:hypothetical protein
MLISECELVPIRVLTAWQGQGLEARKGPLGTPDLDHSGAKSDSASGTHSELVCFFMTSRMTMESYVWSEARCSFVK